MPNPLVKNGPTLAFGLAVLVAFGSTSSVMFGASAGICMLLGVCFSVLIFLWRIKVDLHFRTGSKSIFSFQIIPLLFLSSLCVPLLRSFQIDFASRNFDASYAIQDSIFLSTNSAHLSSDSGDEILPLDWSASLKDRYGVSFLLALIRFLNVSNIWWSAKYVMLFMILMLILTILVLLRALFQTNRLELFTVGAFLLITPSILLPLQYFMFGQVFGLILSFCIIAFLCQIQIHKNSLYFGVFTLVILFISYPAMAFPMALLLLLCILVFNILELPLSSRIVFSGQLFLASFSILIIFYGFRLRELLDRIWVWVSGVLFPVSDSVDLSPLQVTIFGQYASKIGIGLFAGILKYPNFETLNLFKLFLSLLLSLSLLIVFVLSSSYAVSGKSGLVLRSFMYSWMLMALVAYIKGSPYLFFKFSTWIMPIIIGVNIIFLMRIFVSQKFQVSDPLRVTLGVTTTLGLVLSLIVGSQHILQIREWNSFSQVAKTSTFNELNNLKIEPPEKIYLSTPTTEEAVWLSGLLGSIDQNRIQSLGPTYQALGGALSLKCQSGKAQSTFDSEGFILQDEKLLDIVKPLTFKSSPNKLVGSISVNKVKNLVSGIVLNSGGLYPPEILYPKNYADGGAIRWSTGQICLSFYSTVITSQEMSVIFSKGPDFVDGSSWVVSFKNRRIPNQATDNTVNFSFTPSIGWNRIQIQLPGCNHENIVRDRWNLRADDRGLCYNVSAISFKKALNR